MTDEPEKKGDTEAKQPAEGKAQPRKGSFVKYVMFGGAGVALVAVAALVTLIVLGNNHLQVTDVPEESAPAEASDAKTTLNVAADSMATEDLNQSTIEMIRNQLAFLDSEPALNEVESAHEGISVEDSIEAANWLGKKTDALAKKEKELNARRKKLEQLDKEVTQKILQVEQAESARIASLAKLYDGMEARAVAKLMANLDDEAIVAILPRMKIKNASAVLQLLPPQRAAKLSKRMITIAEK